MKLPDTIPTTAGVYTLHNIDKDLYYIGSSKNIRGRILHHLYEFKHHTHYNKQMNTDFDSDQFEFLVLENVIDTTLLLNREHAWYLRYRDRTYNLGIGGRSGPMKGPYTLIDPTGKIYNHILSLPEFYANYKQSGCPSVSSLLKLASGLTATMRGWSCKTSDGTTQQFSSPSYTKKYYSIKPKKSVAKIRYTALHIPSNTIQSITNLAQFCRDNNIPIYIVRGRIERSPVFTYFDWTISRI